MSFEKSLFDSRFHNKGVDFSVFENLTEEEFQVVRHEMRSVFMHDFLASGFAGLKEGLLRYCAERGLDSGDYLRKVVKACMLYPALKRSIIGQEHPVRQVSAILASKLITPSHPKRPKFSAIFLGPTGVGKTELTLEFTRVVFDGDERRMQRLDMSEFNGPDAIRLFSGGPGEPGRVGTAVGMIEDGGTLLFDEIEKADKEVFKFLLEILDAGYIVCGDGRKYSTTNLYIVLTSNVGSEYLMNANVGMAVSKEKYIKTQLMKIMRPEIVARFDLLCVFEKLVMKSLVVIGRQFCGGVLKRFENDPELAVKASVSDAAFNHILREGTRDPKLGARPLRSAFELGLGRAAAGIVMRGIGKGSTCVFDVEHVEDPFTGAMSSVIGVVPLSGFKGLLYDGTEVAPGQTPIS